MMPTLMTKEVSDYMDTIITNLYNAYKSTDALGQDKLSANIRANLINMIQCIEDYYRSYSVIRDVDPLRLIDIMISANEIIDNCKDSTNDTIESILSQVKECKNVTYDCFNTYDDDVRYELFIGCMKEASKLLSDAGFALSTLPDSDSKTHMIILTMEALSNVIMTMKDRDEQFLLNLVYVALTDTFRSRSSCIDPKIHGPQNGKDINSNLFHAGEKLIFASYIIGSKTKQHYAMINGKYELV